MVAAIDGQHHPGPVVSNMLIVDGFATFFRVLVIGIGILTVLSSTQYLRLEHADSAEYYALLLFSVTGQCVMATANELIMVFIGLEISSIATYVLAGYLRDDKRNNEAALKYFLLGSFATAFLLYGIAWIYGTTGSTNLISIHNFLLTPGTERNVDPGRHRRRRSCSSDSRSRFPPRRFRSGRRMSIRARPRRSLCSCRRGPRPPRSRYSCAFS